MQHCRHACHNATPGPSCFEEQHSLHGGRIAWMWSGSIQMHSVPAVPGPGTRRVGLDSGMSRDSSSTWSLESIQRKVCQIKGTNSKILTFIYFLEHFCYFFRKFHWDCMCIQCSRRQISFCITQVKSQWEKTTFKMSKLLIKSAGLSTIVSENISPIRTPF